MIKSLAATALSAVMAITAVVPVEAFPMPAVVGGQPSQVEKVQYSNNAGQGISPYYIPPGYRGKRLPPGYRYRDNHDYRDYQDYRDADYHYWHGHRGYNYYRPGYRRGDDGWWYPLAAFGLAAAIIGGMAAQQARPPVVAVPPDHVRWCQMRYRSYDPYSDTFQPTRGPRQRCISPY